MGMFYNGISIKKAVPEIRDGLRDYDAAFSGDSSWTWAV